MIGIKVYHKYKPLLAGKIKAQLRGNGALQDESLVVSLIQRHLKYTGSAVARSILNDWDTAKADFVKVFPHEFARAIKDKADTKVCLS